MSHFISHKELMHLQCSYLYKDLPFAYIFYREAKRTKKFECFSFDDFSNFYLKWSSDMNNVEILFPA